MRDTGFERVMQDGLSPLIIASHELKTPLVLLRQLSLSLQDRRLSEDERGRIAEQMQLVSERSLRLTTDLTKTQRLEQGLFVMEPVNPMQVCNEVINELSPLYRVYGKQITAKRHRHPGLAVANRDLLRRVLLNFADNALHFANADAAVEIEISNRGHGKIIRLGVRDYGPALSSQTWRQLNTTLSRPEAIHARPGSSGLGLSIARQFAETMNGTTGAIRHRDGATFYVDLLASQQMSLL